MIRPAPCTVEKSARSRLRRVYAFHNDGVIPHASADEAFLPGKRRRGALAHHPVLLAVMLFLPGEVVMVVDLLDDPCAQNSPHDMSRHRLSPGVRVTARQGHGCDIINPQRSCVRDHRGRHIHPIFSASLFKKMSRGLVP